MQYSKPDNARLDEFCWKFLHQKKYVNPAEVLEKILTLSHGQASVDGLWIQCQ